MGGRAAHRSRGRARPADLEPLARIGFSSFNELNRSLHLPPEWETLDQAREVIRERLTSPACVTLVAVDDDGAVLGSNFVLPGDEIATWGPLSVDPLAQGRGVARRLLHRAVAGYSRDTEIALAARRGFGGIDPYVVVENGEIVGHTTGTTFMGHLACGSERAARALYAGAGASGLLKVFLDLLPQHAFAGKTVLPMALCRSMAHLPALDWCRKESCAWWR